LRQVPGKSFLATVSRPSIFLAYDARCCRLPAVGPRWPLLWPLPHAAQAPAALRLTPNLVGQIEQPLRYRPDGGDFVIENGPEFFNRPLYGGNTAFRVDAGDKPEFTLYLPGRGGNLRFGLRRATDAKWLSDAAKIVTRYRPGEMLYEIRDPLLGAEGVLRLTVLAYEGTEGLIVRAELVRSDGSESSADVRRLARPRPRIFQPRASAAAPIELVWAYGGVNGQRGSRDGDIGTERMPISEYFQLQPEFCRGQCDRAAPARWVHPARESGDHRRRDAGGRAARIGRRDALA
jgi:hypothetical protein